VNVEDDSRTDHQQANADHPCKDWNENPVDDIGDELALAPPRRRLVAGRVMSKHRKHQGENNGNRHHLLDGLAEHHQDLHRKAEHDRLVESALDQGVLAAD
jgi:hypothetical protein